MDNKLKLKPRIHRRPQYSEPQIDHSSLIQKYSNFKNEKLEIDRVLSETSNLQLLSTLDARAF